LKLQANGATRHETEQLRIRLLPIETAVKDKLPDCVEASQKLLEQSMHTSTRVAVLETLIDHNTADVQQLLSRLQAVESSSKENYGKVSLSSEEIKRLSVLQTQLEDSLKLELTALKNLTGSTSK
jgi:hypothetical protein